MNVPIPRWLLYTAAIVTVLALVPFALIARARTTTSPNPRIHIIPDMDKQPSLRPQSAYSLFADGRAMRPPVAGAVARGELREDDVLYRGQAGGEWVIAIPIPVTEAAMRRGQERWEVFCTPCHGSAGNGDGPVSRRADRLQEGTWTPPSSLHTELVRSRPAGYLYNSIANGVRNMPAYGSQIPVDDRWAIVAYMRALQRSQHAVLADVPAELQPQLR